MRNYRDGPHGDLGVYVHKVLSAWAEVWTGSWPSRASIMVPELRVAIWTIFEILGGAGDINNSTSKANYCNGPYIRLRPCANKVSSAWTEVWTGTCRSSKRFWFPEVAIWTDFSRFLRFWEGLVI